MKFNFVSVKLDLIGQSIIKKGIDVEFKNCKKSLKEIKNVNQLKIIRHYQEQKRQTKKVM